MSWAYTYLTRKYYFALASKMQSEGATPEQISDTWQRANTGDTAAQAQAVDAYKTGAKMPYLETERSRLLEEGLPVAPDQAFWVAIVYMMAKQPAMLERLAKTFMDTQARIIGNLAQAGAGNIITAYSHSFIIALMLEQNYMIRQRGADDLIASLNVLTAEQALAQLIQGFAVPEILTFAATGIPISPGKAAMTTRALVGK